MTRTVKQLFDLTGKTALVTGGSRGLGLQLAQSLGEAGARIMLSSRKASDLESSAAELKAAGIDVQWIAADCADEKDIHRLAAETLKAFGHVDILVNNAGAAWGAPAEDHPIEAWDKVMNLNVRGYFILSQYIGKHSMIPRHGGSIIFVGLFKGELQIPDPEFHKKETTMMGSRNATEEDFAKVGRLMAEGKVTAGMMLTHRYDFRSLAEIYENDVINNRQLIKGVIHF
jgi:NAD(P)-dependent dehydrogenase (short-subunit alcohol dehydrogenase family)